MNINIRLLSLLIVNCFAVFTLHAQIILPDLVGSNMVLQRNTEVTLWGWAAPSEKISIKPSWQKKSINVVADSDGTWKIKIATTNSTASQSIQLKSKKSNINLQNILFGEVWLCSGQSNMEMPLKGFQGQPIEGSMEAILDSYNANLRLFHVKKVGSKTPLKQLAQKSSWEVCNPESAANFSAIGYFYGQQLQRILNVPVGIIVSSWGGSKIQAWMNEETLQPIQTIDYSNFDFKDKLNQTPTALYNAMIHPMVNYTIKGALWYQGESNKGEFKLYKKLLPAMVNQWRKEWNVGEFPFYFVQIAPYHYQSKEAFQAPANSAYMREAMQDCVALVPNSGIAITTDVGSMESIHPPKKKEIADRLLYLALNKTYGYKNMPCISPIYKDISIKENTIEVHFQQPEVGIYAIGELVGFEIAGEDKVFYPAKATIFQNKRIKVSSDKVSKPVAVRYAWSNFIDGNLFSTQLLPASSFRSDNWEKATRANN